MHRGWLLTFCCTTFVLFSWIAISDGMNVAQRARWNGGLEKHQCFITGPGRVHTFPRASYTTPGEGVKYLMEYPVTVAVTTDGELIAYSRTLLKENHSLLKPEQHVDCFVVQNSQVQVVDQKKPIWWLASSSLVCAMAAVASLGFLVREVEHMVNRTQVGGRKEDMARGDGQGSEEEEEMIMHGRAAEVGNERKKM